MKKIYTIDAGTDAERNVAIEAKEDGSLCLTLDPGLDSERTLVADARSLEQGSLSLLIDNHSYDIDSVESDNVWTLLIRGKTFERHVLDQRKLRMAMASGKDIGASDPSLNTPMAGRVVALLVEEGQSVEQGQRAVIVEAMKMENELKAHRDGVVTRISVQAGDVVEVGQSLLNIEEPG